MSQHTLILSVKTVTIAICLLTIAGCAVKQDETLTSEVKAGAKSRDKASAMQAESDNRNKAGEDVLNGK